MRHLRVRPAHVAIAYGIALAPVSLGLIARAAPASQGAAPAKPPMTTCAVELTKSVTPETLLLGNTARVTMVMSYTCPAERMPLVGRGPLAVRTRRSAVWVRRAEGLHRALRVGRVAWGRLTGSAPRFLLRTAGRLQPLATRKRRPGVRRQVSCCVLSEDPIVADDATVHMARRLDDSFLGFEIDPDDTKALCKTESPFEIIEQ